MVLDTAEVDGVGLKSGNTCDSRFVGNEDVLAVFPEKVDTEAQAISKEAYVNTIVLLGGCFPSNIGVTVAGFACTRHERTVVGTEVTCTVIGPPCTTIVGIELPCAGQIEETANALVITYLTDRTAKFEIGNNVTDRLPEFFRRDYPAERSRREKAKTLTFGEVLRAVIAHVEVYHILGLVVVGDTSHHTYITTGDRIVDTARIVVFRFIIKNECTEIVVTELAGIVEARLCIPVSTSPFGLTVAKRP